MKKLMLILFGLSLSINALAFETKVESLNYTADHPNFVFIQTVDLLLYPHGVPGIPGQFGGCERADMFALKISTVAGMQALHDLRRAYRWGRRIDLYVKQECSKVFNGLSADVVQSISFPSIFFPSVGSLGDGFLLQRVP